jgi:hypothetical protein
LRRRIESTLPEQITNRRIALVPRGVSSDQDCEA